MLLYPMPIRLPVGTLKAASQRLPGCHVDYREYSCRAAGTLKEAGYLPTFLGGKFEIIDVFL